MAKVLVHGGGYGRECWEPLLPHLDGETIAVDLPGRGSRASVALRDVTLDSCAAAVRDDILERDLRDIVLVGHSLGGVTVPRVAVLLPDRIKHIVLLSAVVPPDGASVLDNIDPEVRVAVEAAIVDGVYAQTRDAGRIMLCNDLTDAQCEWALDRVIDDAAALLTEPVDLSGYRLGIPVTYIRLDLDQTVPPDLQAQMQERAGATAVHLPAGHMAMISQAAALADLLNGFDTA